MKRFIVGLALVASGCDTNQTSLTITHIIFPTQDMMTGACTFDSTAPPKAGPLVLDTAASLSLQVPFSVTNNLAARTVDFSPSEDVEANVNTAAEVTPLRFAARFECDTSAYSGARASGLILPRIDPQVSFCVDDRSETSASTANSDILPAYGAAIRPGTAGTAMVRAIPHELGYAIDELWEFARLADGCCRNTTGCSGAGGYADCVRLQELFAGVDGTGGLVAIGAAGTANPTLQEFASYAPFDGQYIAGVDPHYTGRSTPVFSMYMRGVLQGLTGYGEIEESNDYSVQIEVCSNCGINASGGRVPKGENACIRD